MKNLILILFLLFFTFSCSNRAEDEKPIQIERNIPLEIQGKYKITQRTNWSGTHVWNDYTTGKPYEIILKSDGNYTMYPVTNCNKGDFYFSVDHKFMFLKSECGVAYVKWRIWEYSSTEFIFLDPEFEGTYYRYTKISD